MANIVTKLSNFFLGSKTSDDMETSQVEQEVEKKRQDININTEVELAINEFIKEVQETFDPGIFGYSTYGEVLHEINLADVQRNKIDPQIKSCASTLIYSVFGKKEIVFTKQDESEQATEIKEFCEMMVSELNKSANKGEGFDIYTTLKSMMDTMTYYGFVIAEKNYKNFSSKRFPFKRILKSIKVKRIGQFGFKIDNKLNRILGIKNLVSNAVFPLEKFLFGSYNPEFDNYYGSGVIEYLNKLGWAKNKIFQQYLIAIGRKSITPTIVKVTDMDDKETISIAKKILKILQKGGGAIVPADIEYSTEPDTSTSLSDYIAAMDLIDAHIAKTYLGNTLSNNEGRDGAGSYAQSNTHMEITTIHTNDIYRIVINFLKNIFYPLIEYNYDIDEYPESLYPGIKLQDPEFKVLTEINTIVSLTTSGYISPKMEGDCNKVREMFEFSRLTEEEVKLLASYAPDTSSAPPNLDKVFA